MQRLNYNGTKKLPEVFSEEEINGILKQLFNSKDYKKNDWGEWIRFRDISVIATIYLLGLRPKEACSLKFSDFNFQYATAKIRGENNKRKKDRIIPVPKVLIQIYKSYFKFPKARFWRGSKYLFPSLQNNHISPQTLKAIFREKALKPLRLWRMPTKNKISEIRLYTLRHSRATHILKKQIKENGQPDLYAIANFLGHADIRSTTTYLHTDKSYMNYLREQIEI